MGLYKSDLKPFISITLIIFTMLGLVFSKIEVRRLGYNMLKISREYKKMSEHKRYQEMQLAKLTRPDRIEDYAHTKLAMKKAEKGQIIQIAGQMIALSH